MRGAVPCYVPVRDYRKLDILIVDMFRFDEEEISVGERPLVGRFGYRYVIRENLLTLSFVGWCAGSILTIFLDLFVSGIRGRAERNLWADARHDFSFPIRSLVNLSIIVPVNSVGYSCNHASSS